MAVSSGKIPRNFKNAVTKRDRITRTQLTQGIKQSLGQARRISDAAKFLKKDGKSLFSKRSFNRSDVSKRMETLEGGGFLKRGLHAMSATRSVHGTAAATNRLEAFKSRNVEHRKKEYQREERVKVDQKEWAIEQEQKKKAEALLEKKKLEKKAQEELLESRLARASERREGLGFGDELTSRRTNPGGKMTKERLLAEIREGVNPEEHTASGVSGWVGPAALPPTSGTGSGPTGNNGWSAPSSPQKKGL